MAAHLHPVSRTSSGNIYGNDANGNQTSRTVGGITYTLIYDAENRLVQIKRGNNIQATYIYRCEWEYDFTPERRSARLPGV